MDILGSDAGNCIVHVVVPHTNIHPARLSLLVSPDGIVTAAEYT
jgi:hypothetical protein